MLCRSAPLFQACVKNYCDKLLEFHNIDITNQIAQDFLTLRTVFSDFDETELLAKYPPELAEKLIFNNNNIQVLEKQNNNNFAFTINHHLYITKNPKNADFKISVDRNSNSKGTIIREIRNPNNTHIFSHGKLTKYIKEELEKRLRGRNTDSEEVIQARLKNSLKELEYEDRYDRVIINNEIEQACNDLISIIENGVR